MMWNNKPLVCVPDASGSLRPFAVVYPGMLGVVVCVVVAGVPVEVFSDVVGTMTLVDIVVVFSFVLGTILAIVIPVVVFSVVLGTMLSLVTPVVVFSVVVGTMLLVTHVVVFSVVVGTTLVVVTAVVVFLL